MILASHIIDISRLWTTVMLLAVVLPPGLWLIRHRREWLYSLRGLFLCLVVVSLAFLFLWQDLKKFWEYWGTQSGASLSRLEWELPLMIVICSGFVTWAVTREPFVENLDDEESG